MDKEFNVDVKTRFFFSDESEAKSFFDKFRTYLQLQKCIYSNSELMSFDDVMLFVSKISQIEVKLNTKSN